VRGLRVARYELEVLPMKLNALRERLASSIDASLGPFDSLQLQAIRVVPRERFVRREDVGQSAEDIPLPLDDHGFATISAPHAYLLSFRLLGLRPGDRLVELGSGSGYGAALAAYIVGERGRVLTIEIDRDLAAQAKRNLAPYANVEAMHGDAVESSTSWGDANRIVCTFAIDAVPQPWLGSVPEGGILVAPVGSTRGEQELVRFERQGGRLDVSEHGGVRYVKNRSRRVS
jgi:protein-L-isoaspartate(D-aspartate) O-methyltransferase